MRRYETIRVVSPRPKDSFEEMGKNLTKMLVDFKAKGKHVRKIVIEVNKLTEVTIVIVPKQWGRKFSRAYPIW